MIVDEDPLHCYIEFSLFNLVGGRKVRVQFELLSHFVDHNVSTIVVLFNFEGNILHFFRVRGEGNTAVDQLVGAVLVLLYDLILLIKELLSQDKAILLSVMIEIEFSVAAVDSYHLLPVVVLQGALVMLDQLELVREASTNDELILTAGVVRSNFIGNQSLVVLVEGDALDKSINLATL